VNGDNKTVYILGAGCSAGAAPEGPGFPLADKFESALDQFSRGLDGDDRRRLRSCVEETVQLLRVERAQTLDALVARLASEARDLSKVLTTKERNQRDLQVNHAKIATAALFLDLERRAKATPLSRYHNFLDELFGNSVVWNQASQQSRSSVLAFNYDRLFEMAFISRFKADIHQKNLYGKSLLNSGDFTDGTQLECDPNRFAFLKLHGTVGIRVQNGPKPHYHTLLDGNPGEDSVPINDDLYFSPPSNSIPWAPLLVFPHEKPFVRKGTGTQHSLRDYIPFVWSEAHRLVGEATEIWAIGYRFAPIDREDVLDLLRSAKNCRRLVIQNLPGYAENICQYLKWRWLEPAGIDLKVEPFPQPF
jgi:hypothetical protein